MITGKQRNIAWMAAVLALVAMPTLAGEYDTEGVELASYRTARRGVLTTSPRRVAVWHGNAPTLASAHHRDDYREDDREEELAEMPPSPTASRCAVALESHGTRDAHVPGRIGRGIRGGLQALAAVISAAATVAVAAETSAAPCRTMIRVVLHGGRTGRTSLASTCTCTRPASTWRTPFSRTAPVVPAPRRKAAWA